MRVKIYLANRGQREVPDQEGKAMNRPTPTHRTVLTVFRRAAAVLTILAAGQTASPQDTKRTLPTFFKPVEVPIVNVDVYVSDRKGRPVSGMTIDDFEVFEDGDLVKLTHFYAAKSGVTDGNNIQAETEMRVEQPPAQPETPSSQELYLVILFDNTNLSRGRRQAAIEHLRGFLTGDLPPQLQVMLATYDGGIRIRHPFTDQPPELLAALEEVVGQASLSRQLEQDRLLREIDTALAVAARGGLQADEMLQANLDAIYFQIQNYADNTRQRTIAGLETTSLFVRSLSGVPGRRAMLLVNDGIEPRPGERLFHAWEQAALTATPNSQPRGAMLRANQYSISHELREFTRQANANRVTIYTVSALVDHGLARVSAARSGATSEDRYDVQQMISEEQVMTGIAASTGGRTLVNSPALSDQLAEVAVELGSFYSLGYEPDHLGDGSYHRLEVRVKRKGLQLRHREGYFDTPIADRLPDRTLAAALLGVSNNGLGIAVECQEARPRDDGTWVIPVLVRVPIGQLVLLPEGREHQGRISIFLAVRDTEGGLSDVKHREFPIPVENDQMTTAISKTAGFILQLAVREGRQRIAVGFRDEIARTEAIVTVEVDVGPQDS